MKSQLIYKLYPEVKSMLDDEAFDADGNVVAYDKALIQAEYDSKQYARDRAIAYPTQNEQNDMAYWDRQNNTTTLDDAISAVKTTYPKPGV